ncbi:MAG: YggT family protein [Alphaproteobacteria bacterium]|nr:YggT family protein [Alphaproteobacteria bacterium]
MDIVVVPLLLLLKAVIGLAIIVVIADVMLSWLVAANVLNTNNQFVYLIIDTLSRISSFMLDPIRKRMPINMGMLDLSPVILILALSLLENVINRVLMRF